MKSCRAFFRAEFNIKMDKRFGGDLVRMSIFCKMG